MDITDILTVLHPMIAVAIVFPLIGIAINLALQTRQRRLQTASEGKSKIPGMVGIEHVKTGRYLTGAVVGSALLALTYSIGSQWYEAISKHSDKWTENIAPGELFGVKFAFFPVFVVLIYVATIAAFVLLYKAREKVWRAAFATLTGMGLIILGCQDGVYRLDNAWWFSHYYYGMGAAMLMIFALSIVPDIYQDRTNTWRKVHITLNCLATILFLGQAFTGSRDLLEIPLGWQKPYVYGCNFEFKTCPTPKSSIDRPFTTGLASYPTLNQ